MKISTRQFKREPSADAKMAGEIVASANCGGGRIFVGVEKDGPILGLSGGQAEKVRQDLAKVAWNAVRPPSSILSRSIGTSDGIVVVSLRHTRTTMLKSSGVSDSIARAIIGHQSVAQSQTYTHLDIETMSNAPSKAFNHHVLAG